jgi:hypothetical protein
MKRSAALLVGRDITQELIMSKLTYTLLMLLVAASVPSWAVTNAVVGTCRTGTTYTTIQSAIDAAAVGSTVQVCPGTYPEVLTITKNLTLKGVAAGNSNSVIITVPSGGVPSNGTSGLWGSLEAHVLVKGAAVHFSNFTINGAAPCTLGGLPVGIMFQGADGSSMTNSLFLTGTTSCGGTMGAFIDVSTNVNFSNNSFRDCYSRCIEVDYDGAGTMIKNNIISATAASAAGIGAQSLTGPTIISGNVIAGNFAEGILAAYSDSVTITTNSVTPAIGGVGVALSATTHSTVQSNRVFSYYGIVLDDQGAVGGNTVTKNTLIGGICGLDLNKTNQGDTTAPNTFANQTTNVCTFLGI